MFLFLCFEICVYIVLFDMCQVLPDLKSRSDPGLCILFARWFRAVSLLKDSSGLPAKVLLFPQKSVYPSVYLGWEGSFGTWF